MVRTIRKIMKQLLYAALSLFCLQNAHADKVHVPKPGTPERKAIMDGLRGWLKENNHFPGKDVVFVVYTLKVHNGWAWITAAPQTRKDAKPLSDSGTWLLRLKDGVWKSVDYPELVDDMEPDAAFLKKLHKMHPDVPADIFD
jgi:hypothetical protein